MKKTIIHREWVYTGNSHNGHNIIHEDGYQAAIDALGLVDANGFYYDALQMSEEITSRTGSAKAIRQRTTARDNFGFQKRVIIEVTLR